MEMFCLSKKQIVLIRKNENLEKQNLKSYCVYYIMLNIKLHPIVINTSAFSLYVPNTSTECHCECSKTECGNL